MSPATRYPTRRERESARRATFNRRYEAYRELCADLGVALAVQASWSSHYAELRRAEKRCAAVNAELLAARDLPAHWRYWLERFTLAEIRELAGFVP